MTTPDFLNTRTLRQRLSAGREALGMWLGITDALAVEAIAADCSLDWVLLDMEHGGGGWRDLQQVLLGWKNSTVPLLIRPPSHDQKFLMRALDLGVSGFVIPFVNTVEEATDLAAACRYPPRGIRGVAPRRVSHHYTKTDQYLESANDDVFVMVQIEHKTAVEHVEDIAKSDVDALFIGPGDMSHSYGLPGQIDHPTMVSAIERVINAGKVNGKPIAMAVDDTPSAVVARINQGIQLVTIGLDWMFLREGMNAQANATRELLS